MAIGGSYSSSQKGPRAVWPWYGLAVIFLFATAFGWLTQQPWDIPKEDELVETGGDIARFYVLDDVFGTRAGGFLPILGSVYIHFKDAEGAFRYPWTHPQYDGVRRDFGVNATIWVRASDLAKPAETRDPPKIWGIKENNRYKNEHFPEIFAPPAQVITAKREAADNLKRNSLIMIGIAVVAIFVARLTRRSNRRKFPAHFGIRPETED